MTMAQAKTQPTGDFKNRPRRHGAGEGGAWQWWLLGVRGQQRKADNPDKTHQQDCLANRDLLRCGFQKGIFHSESGH